MAGSKSVSRGCFSVCVALCVCVGVCARVYVLTRTTTEDHKRDIEIRVKVRTRTNGAILLSRDWLALVDAVTRTLEEGISYLAADKVRVVTITNPGILVDESSEKFSVVSSHWRSSRRRVSHSRTMAIILTDWKLFVDNLPTYDSTHIDTTCNYISTFNDNFRKYNNNNNNNDSYFDNFIFSGVIRACLSFL